MLLSDIYNLVYFTSGLHLNLVYGHICWKELKYLEKNFKYKTIHAEL